MFRRIKEEIEDFIDSVEYFWQEDRFFIVVMLTTLITGIATLGFILIMLLNIILG
nr:hypothetical protein [uncultured Mogibacterium sp.]